MGGASFGCAFDASIPNFGIFYTDASPDVVIFSRIGSARDGSF